VDRDLVTDYAKWMRDQPRVAKFLMFMMDNEGKSVEHAAVAEVIGHKGKNPGRTVTVMANRLRSSLWDKLGPGEWVETVYGQGYRVTRKAASEIRAAMEGVK